MEEPRETLFFMWSIDQMIVRLLKIRNDLKTNESYENYLNEISDDDKSLLILVKRYVSSENFMKKLTEVDLNLAMSVAHTLPLLNINE